MPFVTTCAQCRKKVRVAEESQGNRVKCPHCGKPFVAEPPPLDVLPADEQFEPRPATPRSSSRRILVERQPDRDEDEPGQPLKFKMAIKSDPEKLLHGAYRARVTPHGLQLSKNKERPIVLAVGTAAEYLGGNRLALTLAGREVEVRVTKLAAYQQRLARDVAAFLKGEHGFDPHGYAMEWYVFVPVALPLVIPIITLGGALPAALGCGLAGGCYAIAQKENWPKGVRLAAALGLAAAGYLVVLAVVIGTLLLQRESSPDSANQVGPAQQAANGSDQAEEEVLAAVPSSPAPLRSRPSDTVYRLSNPRDLTDQLGRHTLTVDYEKVRAGDQDGAVLMVCADNGQRLAVTSMGPPSQPRGTFLARGPFGTFGQLQFPKNLEFYLTRSDTRYGISNPTFKVSNSAVLGTMPSLTLARNWTDQETARLNQPPPNYTNANAHPNVGADSPFAGDTTGGGAFRYVEPGGLLLGVEYRLGEWDGEQCLGGLVPIFSRTQPPALNAQRVVAGDGYAVGAFKVQSKRFVDALQVVFLRIKPDGRLDPSDAYSSAWLGFPGQGSARTIGGDGTRVIGIHCRQGAILNGIALVLERGEPAVPNK